MGEGILSYVKFVRIIWKTWLLTIKYKKILSSFQKYFTDLLISKFVSTIVMIFP